MSQTVNSSMISVQGISKHYGSFQALQHVDLEIAKGEFVVLLGGRLTRRRQSKTG